MDLLKKLIQEGYLKTSTIIEAFKNVKREDFVLPGQKDEANIDAPLPIGYGQTISQPLTVAFMLELLQPRKGQKILDIGSGSGWTVALLRHIIGKEGKVYGLEIIDELVKFGKTNIEKYKYISDGSATIIYGDGYKGLPELALFDRIIVSAAAQEVPPSLLSQLKISGRLVIPIGPEHHSQEIVMIEKTALENYERSRFPGFIFVPLIKK